MSPTSCHCSTPRRQEAPAQGPSTAMRSSRHWTRHPSTRCTSGCWPSTPRPAARCFRAMHTKSSFRRRIRKSWSRPPRCPCWGRIIGTGPKYGRRAPHLDRCSTGTWSFSHPEIPPCPTDTGTRARRRFMRSRTHSGGVGSST